MQGLFWKYFFWHAWNHMNQSVVSQRNHAEKHSSHQQLTAGEPTRCSERSGWKHDLMAWKTYEFIIYKIFQHISYFSQLHLASGGKGQKWKPRVIQQSSGKFFYSRPFWTWKCIYKWLVPFPFLLWGEVGPKTARMCQCVSHLVTFLSLHSRKLTNIVPEKMVVFEQSSPFVLTSLFWWSILVSGFLLLYSEHSLKQKWQYMTLESQPFENGSPIKKWWFSS